MNSLLRIAVLPALLLWFSSAFSPTGFEPSALRNRIQPLHSGTGIAPTYTWQEECFEIEISVKVPEDTKASDIAFRAKPDSIELKLKSSEEGSFLLDPSRKLRGRVVLDGTYWVIADPETKDEEPHRLVTVTIEKQVRTPKDDFDVIEYDWNGVYEDDEEEVSYRKYDEPEELNVREYAASMGVDIDNIDMNLVDKTMFTSGLNLTKSTFDNMKEAGLMTEVTEQTDGSEWIVGDDGEKVPFSSMGDGVSKDELKSAKAPIPFLDTNSPWHTSVPLDQAKKVKDMQEEQEEKADDEEEKQEVEGKAETQSGPKEIPKDAKDPIDTLTVAKLKEVLRSRGLKVSGNKKELQERLRAEVQSLLQSNDDKVD